MECEQCGSNNFTKEEGDYYCSECGELTEKANISKNKNYRAFTQKEKDNVDRHGHYFKYSDRDSSFGSKIGGRGDLKQISPDQRRKFSRIKRWHNREKADDSGQNYGMKRIQLICAKLDLPDAVLEESSRLYRKIRDEKISVGRRTEDIVAGLVYIVARQQNAPRLMTEFNQYTDDDIKKLRAAYKKIARELDLRIIPIQPSELLHRYATKLGMNQEQIITARNILEHLEGNHDFTGKSTKATLGGAIEYAIYESTKDSHRMILQKDIAKELGVTNTTLRKTRKEIQETLGQKQVKVEG